MFITKTNILDGAVTGEKEEIPVIDAVGEQSECGVQG